MIVKLLIGLVILIALARMFSPRRPAVRADKAEPPPRVPQAHDLEKCDRCGIWLPAGRNCDCKALP